MIMGIGTDIIEIKRIQQALEKHGKRFEKKIFTLEEQGYCQSKNHPVASFAVRFAAKEAVSKAFGLGIGRIRWLDIEIVNDNNGQPQVVLSGYCKQLAQENGIKQILISLSHSKEYATAVAVLEGGINCACSDHRTDEND